VKLPRFAGLLLAVAMAAGASLTVSSPVSADNDGPIKNIGNHLCLQPESRFQGAPILQVECSVERNLDQEWTFFCWDGCSRIHVVNAGSGLCLSARAGAKNGTPVELWTCNQISNEKWDNGPTGINIAPPFELRSRVSNTTSHCLDVPGAADTVGLAMQLWTCNGTVAQLWETGPPVIG
jgi:hypothetical protein